MPKPNVSISEPNTPQLVVALDTAKQKIMLQIKKGKEILDREVATAVALTGVEAEYSAWREYTRDLLYKLFDSTSIGSEFWHVGESFVSPIYYSLQEALDDHKHYVKSSLLKLNSILERLPLFEANEPSIDNGIGYLKVLEQIANRFHIVARQMRRRHHERPTLDVVDEYDVQDLVHALLRLSFDDIRDEEWTPSYAGGSARMDFLLKKEQAVVEVKKTRKGLLAKEIGNQLIEDIGRYRVHQDCKTLVCFVYDPDGYINNPDGIERDLSRNSDGLSVKVIINPKGH